jgi:hypothetical protein
MNAHYEDIDFKISPARNVAGWRLLVDSGRGLVEPKEPPVSASVSLPSRALMLFEASR